MSGKAGRSGRKPAPKVLIDRMLARSEPRLPDIWQGLIDLATGVRIGTLDEAGKIVNVYSRPPDKDAIAEVVNRHFGKPKIEVDQRLTAVAELDPSLMLEAIREARAIEAKWLLDVGKPSESLPAEASEKAGLGPILAEEAATLSVEPCRMSQNGVPTERQLTEPEHTQRQVDGQDRG